MQVFILNTTNFKTNYITDKWFRVEMEIKLADKWFGVEMEIFLTVSDKCLNR